MSSKIESGESVKRTVTVIPATVTPHTQAAEGGRRRRVAGYARVSTDHADQVTHL